MMNFNNPLPQYDNEVLVSEFVIPVAPIKYVTVKTMYF